MINAFTLILSLIISTMAYSDNLDITFKGAIVEPACIIVADLSSQCDRSTKDAEFIKIFNQEENSLTIADINDFITSYQSTKAKIKLNQYIEKKQMMNLSLIYK